MTASLASVRIVTDSSCDLPADVAAELGIEIVPLSIRFGDEEFIDRESAASAIGSRTMLIVVMVLPSRRICSPS